MTELETAAWAVIRAWRTAGRVNPTERATSQMRMAIHHLAVVSGFYVKEQNVRHNRRLEAK